MVDLLKRRLLKQGMLGLSVYGAGAVWSNALIGAGSLRHTQTLQAADENGVRLPRGLRSRIIARSSQPVIAGRDYKWHAAPDGGACFAAKDGGWIYVSNSEMRSTGGVGAIVFDVRGEIIDAYPILENTRDNCAGGATPWGSWLSCEEYNHGRVWECYPDGKTPAVVRPALGVFNHEAVAVDEVNKQLYLTEDKRDGCLYRFTADHLTAHGYPDLSAGILEVATMQQAFEAGARGILGWLPLPDALAEMQPTRYQQASALTFDGGEGITWFDGKIIFTTKGNNRVCRYDTRSQLLDVVYDAADSLTPILTGVDNVTVSQSGEIYVAEDGGDMQVVVIDAQGALYPLLQIAGHNYSEVAGLAFSPDGKRLYFSSQRGATGRSENGVTYEISGF